MRADLTFNIPPMMQTSATIHASAVLCGSCGILIRGPSGSGKSSLALSLLQTGSFARLIGDDRIHLQTAHGRLLMRPAKTLEGLIEIRGLGIRRLPFEPVALVHLAVDLAAPDAERLPEPASSEAKIEGVSIARLAVAPGRDALPSLLAFLQYGKAPAGLPPA
jgi:serine kinase of HPr protein (carbohydrate metabolism regulator)